MEKLILDNIGNILSLCKSIFLLVSEVKANKKRCRHLADRVKVMQELVETIMLRGPRQISPVVKRTLVMLITTLRRAQELIRKCTKTKFLNLIKCKSEFDNVNETLRDIFQILSGALQVEQGTMMQRMFQDYTVEEDDEWALDMGLFAPAPYTGAMAPASLPHASVAPLPYFPPPAPTPQPPIAFLAVAAMVVGDDSIYYEEGAIIMQ